MKKMTAMLLALLCLSACGAPKQETTKTAEQPEQTTADTVQEQPKSEPYRYRSPNPNLNRLCRWTARSSASIPVMR